MKRHCPHLPPRRPGIAKPSNMSHWYVMKSMPGYSNDYTSTPSHRIETLPHTNHTKPRRTKGTDNVPRQQARTPLLQAPTHPTIRQLLFCFRNKKQTR